jgi:hypothetical protein
LGSCGGVLDTYDTFLVIYLVQYRSEHRVLRKHFLTKYWSYALPLFNKGLGLLTVWASSPGLPWNVH